VRLPAGLAVGLAALTLAGNAGASTRSAPLESPAFAVPDPTQLVRDTVIAGRPPRLARGTATASAQRYPVHDDRGRTVEIGVSAFCNPVTCNAADPQAIADFLGTLAHGVVFSMMTVLMLSDC
jgi:hypothetical protein